MTKLTRPVADDAVWVPIDVRAVDTARLLVADTVQRAGNGHPGTAMSLAPLAHLLFQNVMRHGVRPADANKTAACWRAIRQHRQPARRGDQGARGIDALPGMVRPAALSYRDKVLPPAVRARVSVEPGIGQTWREIVGDTGRIVSLEHFCISRHQRLYQEFAITAQAVAAAAKESLHDLALPARPGGRQQTATPTTGGTGDRPARPRRAQL